MPEISVIIPVYNAEKTIVRVLDSLSGQTFTDFETILVDDGSKDNSYRICSEYSKKLGSSAQKVLRFENSGPSAARNRGVEAASGKYICFIDSDDDIDSNYLEVLHGLIENSSSDLAMCGYRKQNQNGSFTDYPAGECSHYSRQKALEEFFVNNTWIGPTNKIFKSELIRKNDIKFNSELKKGEDALFVCEYLIHANGVECSDQNLYYYLFNPHSITRSIKEKKGYNSTDADNLKAHALMRKLIQEQPQEVQKSLDCRYVNTYMRTLSNLWEAGISDPRLTREAVSFIRKHLNEYFGSRRISSKMKLGALLCSISPKMFAYLYSKI
ncbi:glycosyltransferase family 2 protein [Allobaculum mucilyticum]|uniref:glycosyltransferase family 2 protein n=1 Tax=Allobaculum mucilyticum TaxID=2834459 RepID=UPI001E53D5E4|nr:glycosyltransferase [Allobaculum mucilyticum]UNT95029.1 glycosyltransferase [Allobaculum mucilyticum]